MNPDRRHLLHAALYPIAITLLIYLTKRFDLVTRIINGVFITPLRHIAGCDRSIPFLYIQKLEFSDSMLNQTMDKIRSHSYEQYCTEVDKNSRFGHNQIYIRAAFKNLNDFLYNELASKVFDVESTIKSTNPAPRRKRYLHFLASALEYCCGFVNLGMIQNFQDNEVELKEKYSSSMSQNN